VSPLTEAQREELRTELLRALARLKESMRMSDEALAPVELDQSTVGRLSRMDSLQNQELTRNLHEREELKLSALEQALARLENGSYGLCTTCGGEIAFGRLMVYPEAAECGECGGS
jgi:DnaK suppressor protein